MATAIQLSHYYFDINDNQSNTHQTRTMIKRTIIKRVLIRLLCLMTIIKLAQREKYMSVGKSNSKDLRDQIYLINIIGKDKEI